MDPVPGGGADVYPGFCLAGEAECFLRGWKHDMLFHCNRSFMLILESF